MKDGGNNPHGVPHAHNDCSFATGPCWILTFRRGRRPQPFERRYFVRRETEARSRLSADEPEAYDITATFAEVPLD